MTARWLRRVSNRQASSIKRGVNRHFARPGFRTCHDPGRCRVFVTKQQRQVHHSGPDGQWRTGAAESGVKSSVVTARWYSAAFDPHAL